MNIFISWLDLKSEIVQKDRLRYLDRDTFYHITYKDDAGTFETTILKDSGSDHTDFETNYKGFANKKLSTIDDDGASISRPKAAKKGWTYNMCPIEFCTADLDSVYSKKYDGSDRTTITYKLYDVNDNEITDSAYEGNAVKTVVDFEASYDYEIIGGDIKQISTPSTNIRVWVVGAPDISEAYGGSKEMCGGVNLKFIGAFDRVRADGRVAKYMPYSNSLHTNKLRLILRHDAGVQHNVMLVLETFKA